MAFLHTFRPAGATFLDSEVYFRVSCVYVSNFQKNQKCFENRVGTQRKLSKLLNTSFLVSGAVTNRSYRVRVPEDVLKNGKLNRPVKKRCGIRLKGHIGAAGKATLTWGDLKTQE